MLILEINNQNIPLPPDISIPFVLNNPLFETNGSFSYTLNLPLTKELDKALGFINYPDKKGLPSVTVQGTLGYQGGNMWPVYCYAKKTDNKTANLYFRMGLGSFNERTKNMMLQDLSLGGEQNIPAVIPTLDLQYPDSAYAMFPVHNENFADDTGYEIDYKDNVIFQNYPSGIYQNISPAFFEILTPFPYVGYVLEQIFKENGYTVEKNRFKTHADLKKICEFNTTAILTVYASGNYTSIITGYVTGKTYLTKHLPELSIINYINNIRNRYNIHFFVNEFSGKVKILLGDEILNDPDYIEIDNIAGKSMTKLIETKYESLAIKSEQETLDYYIETYFKDITEFKDKIIGEIDSLLTPTSFSPNDVYLLTLNNAFYEMQLTYDGVSGLPDWNFVLLAYNRHQDYYSSHTQPMLIFETGNSSVNWEALGLDVRDGARSWLVPQVGQKGNLPYRIDKVGMAHRHLLYHGLKKDSNDDDYPFGSWNNFDFGNNKVGDLQLSFNGTYGIYEQLWKNFVDWKLNRAQTFETWINFPSYLLFNFPWEKKFRIRNTNYLVKKIEVDLRYKAPVVKKCEIVKC